MLYLDLHFSCTQRLMTPISPGIKDPAKDRVYAVFSSVFLLVDASVHLFAATYKGFIWTASQISRKNPPDYYKEAYSHLVKALRCTSMILFGSLVGSICPGKFQSKELQEYLGWKLPLRNTSEITENNKVLEEELQLAKGEIERLKLQIDSLTRSNTSNALQDGPQSVSYTLATMANSTPSYTRSRSSSSQDSQPLKMNLASDEPVKSIPSYEDTISLSSEDEFIDAEEGLNNIEKLEKELQLKNKEIEKLKLQKDLLNKILFPLGTLHPYNQILSIQKALNKSIGDTPTVYEYLSDPVKQKITDSFQDKFKMNFLQFCNQEKPDIDSTSDIFADLLKEYPLGWLELKEVSISKAIGFV